MGDRYDHRTDEARAADAAEPEVIDQPIEPGAVALRDEALAAEERTAREDDSAAETEGRHRRPDAG
jgi:hypothetical protein